MSRRPRGEAKRDALVALGAEKLANLVLSGMEDDAGFRRIVAAALASAKGGEAVAAVIDRRLAALERARGFIDYDKSKTFAADLAATVKTITGELASKDPMAAARRLLRFIATQVAVEDRVDDSQGRVQAVFEEAALAMGPLATAMPEADRLQLPDLVTAALLGEGYGYGATLVEGVAATLPPEVLKRWGADLAARQVALPAKKGATASFETLRQAMILMAAREAITEASGDIDGLIALERAKPPQARNPIALAEMLLTAGRAEEALKEVRREGGPSIRYMTHAMLADGGSAMDYASRGRASLEARILTALGRKADAEAVRWSHFTRTLDADMLREHIEALDEFAEFDVLDRAFDLAASSKDIHAALVLFLEWPRLDRAARLVVAQRGSWEGRHYEILAPAAEALEDADPVAATILYRALLLTILDKSRSNAYGAAARHLARLDALAALADAGAPSGFDPHATFRASLQRTHGRKAAFWALADKAPRRR